ncbi:sulfatase-like hydrolase/transferase [Pontiellaceae bacterium B12219]|nr:sulfatase-like hydrolase/transferase [Pontiellaceae bacterium B12219]
MIGKVKRLRRALKRGDCRLPMGRSATHLSCWIVLACGIQSAIGNQQSAMEKPNIIFILTDDQGYGDLGRHGHPVLETPNLDRLHDESVRFDNFYVSPSCSPTRAALMTGMHEFRNGVTHTLEPREHLYKEATILPQLLKTAGYKTGFIGKWHLSDRAGYGPAERGFDWTATNQGGPRQHFDVQMIRNKKRFPTKGFREDAYFDEAMAFVDEAGDQPFFLYLCTYSPHTPLDAPEDLIEKYRAKGLNDKHATYMAMIENIDQNVGRLMTFLAERDLAEDTIIMFINDNGVTEGLDVYNAGMRGCKATCWEGGTRAMSFWKWPGHWKPHTANNLTAHIDVLPTLCELAGVEIPADLQSELQGYSLIPLLEADQDVHWKHDNRFLFHHVGRWPSGTAAAHKHSMGAVRQGNYLLMRSVPCSDPLCEQHQSQCTTLRAVQRGLKTTTYTQGNAQYHWGVTPSEGWALFDVKKDPGCLDNVAAAHPERVASMIKTYDQWWDEQYPIMMARGGDEGDPDASKNAASRSRQHAAKVAAEKKISASKANAVQKTGMFDRLDANGDQQVTQAEYLALFVPTFGSKDADHDGMLTPEEFPYVGSFNAGDTDQDGLLTPAEFEDMYSHQFNSRDANRDGVITADEM